MFFFSFQMGLSRLNRLLALVVLVVALVYGWQTLFEARTPPCYSVDVKYFGAGAPPSSSDNEDFTVRPFTVPFDRVQVEDMLDRVKKTRFYEPQILVDNRHVNKSTYGFNRQTAEMVREYLINTFEWKKTVQELNTFDHFKTNIAVGPFSPNRVRMASPSVLLGFGHSLRSRHTRCRKQHTQGGHSIPTRLAGLLPRVPRRRPTNERIDNEKLRSDHSLPPWLRLLGCASSQRNESRTDGPHHAESHATSRLQLIRRLRR